MEQLFLKWAGEPCVNKTQITANGSNRLYFRLEGNSKCCMATVNSDVRENEAFFFFASEMRRRGVNVPEVYAISDDRTTYLQQDLGNVSLYNFIASRKTNGIDVDELTRLYYRKAIDGLINMQMTCSDIDFSHAYPRPRFDSQALQWDVNYFKYYFLRLFNVPFDEQLLENDFHTFIEFLLLGDCDCFMFRDFQSRNIMLVDDEPWFIDFQGARLGAPQYDLASLLYSSKSDIPGHLRDELLEYYMDKHDQVSALRDSDAKPLDRDAFRTRYYAYLLARIMQAMGAYGYRGIIEKKEYFVKSIPLAVNNLRHIIKEHPLPLDIPHLSRVWDTITSMAEYASEKEGLTVSVFSFSYRKGIPFDKSGNGGGYVFDCRALPNPGLYDEYKQLNGRDQEVVDFFLRHPETEQYLSHVRALVSQTVQCYQERGYNRLMLNFGCTGGRHRSVYCAEKVAQYINNNFNCTVVIHHLEQGKLRQNDS